MSSRPASPTSGPAPGRHGGDGLEVARRLGVDPATLLDLSASLNPFAPDVAAVVRNHLDALQRYPDATTATAAMAAAIGVDPDRLVLTNGGAEAIALVAAELGAGEVTGPEFSLYARHLATVADGAPRWRSNPNNPLGTLAPADAEAMVWDEAFYPMVTGSWTRGDDGSFRLGSLTKLWACPGLRLGFVIAPSVTAAVRLRDRQPRWAVNGLALDALPELLAKTNLAEQSDRLRSHRAEVDAHLRSTGLHVHDGVAPWFLVDGPSSLRDDLAQRGIVVRDCTNFGLPGTYRIALPNPDSVERVIDAVRAVRR